MRHFIACAFAALVLLASCTNVGQADWANIVPQPADIQTAVGQFSINGKSTIGYDEGLEANARLLAGYIEAQTGLSLAVQQGEGDIRLTADGAEGEGYTLTVNGDGISIDGASPAGNFYGCQSLRKALPVIAEGKPYTSVDVPAVLISDQPRFSYRGVHLDCSRHFFPAEFIKKYIDILALHNVNTLHWHVTDDQGWRIEIKSLPELAEKGSVRKQTMIRKEWENFDGTPCTGFYTQDECREIVAYAAERHINVIPEIDMPGHMVAALHVFPELGCTGGPYEVCQIWGVMPDVLCMGNPKTMDFLKQVFAEVCDIFPSKYIHIGGDECPRDRWKECPKCRKLAAELARKAGAPASEAADKHRYARLQNYVTAEIEKFLQERGREIIGWDEILEGEVAPGATIMSWTGVEGGTQAAKMGHDAIMTPGDYCYFDRYQCYENRDETEPFAIGGYLPVSQVYEYEPVPAELSPEEAKHILGAQCNIWTEYMLDSDHVEYMLLPRLAALAEVNWGHKTEYSDFERRLSALEKIYDINGFNYRRQLDTDSIKPEPGVW